MGVRREALSQGLVGVRRSAGLRGGRSAPPLPSSSTTKDMPCLSVHGPRPPTRHPVGGPEVPEPTSSADGPCSRGGWARRRPRHWGGAVVAGSAPAQEVLTVAEHEDHGRMQYYKLATSSVGWLSRVNVLLPDGYDTCAATRALPAARRRRGLLDLRHKIRHPQPHRRARPHCCHARRRGGRLVLRPRVLQRPAHPGRGGGPLGELHRRRHRPQGRHHLRNPVGPGTGERGQPGRARGELPRQARLPRLWPAPKAIATRASSCPASRTSRRRSAVPALATSTTRAQAPTSCAGAASSRTSTPCSTTSPRPGEGRTSEGVPTGRPPHLRQGGHR